MDFLAFQISRHQIVVKFRGRFDQFHPGEFGLFAHVLGDLVLSNIGTACFRVEVTGLHREKIDHAPERVGVLLWTSPNRNGDGDGAGLEAFPHLSQHAIEVGSNAIHLVDEANSGDIVFIRLPPDRFALRLRPLPPH